MAHVKLRQARGVALHLGTLGFTKCLKKLYENIVALYYRTRV
jgi:hypothetical protein